MFRQMLGRGLPALGGLVLMALAGLVPVRAEPSGLAEREFQECADCPVMVAIPAGRFTMGSPTEESGRFDAEGPQHPVSVKAFAMAKHQVTSEQFLAFLRDTGYRPGPCQPALGLGWSSPGRGLAHPPGGVAPPDWPATCLSWNDAEAYIAWLNGKVRTEGRVRVTGPGPYRLPSEAEWEYAARAGTQTARWWGDAIGTNNANCNGCGSRWDGRELAPVDAFVANPFGLAGMLGNVWQWTADCWNESYIGAPSDGSAWLAGDCSRRVLRGGSWSNNPLFVRSAARSKARAVGGDGDYSTYAGFRIARTLP